jgi:hypothetical protein
LTTTNQTSTHNGGTGTSRDKGNAKPVHSDFWWGKLTTTKKTTTKKPWVWTGKATTKTPATSEDEPATLNDEAVKKHCNLRVSEAKASSNGTHAETSNLKEACLVDITCKWKWDKRECIPRTQVDGTLVGFKPEDTDATSTPDEQRKGAAAAAVVCSLVLLGLAFWGAYYYRKHKHMPSIQRRFKKRSGDSAPITEDTDDHGSMYVNPLATGMPSTDYSI